MSAHRRRVVGLAVPALLSSMTVAGALTEVRAVPVGDIEVWGALSPEAREVAGAMLVHVKTPIGRIPITGRAHARYDCDATFSGALRYSGLVRLFARLKGVSLVTRAEGAVEHRLSWACATPPDSFRGRVSIRDTILTGFLRIGGDSIPLQGDAWSLGAGAYHARFEAQRDANPFTVRIDVYERGAPRVLVAASAHMPMVLGAEARSALRSRSPLMRDASCRAPVAMPSLPATPP